MSISMRALGLAMAAVAWLTCTHASAQPQVRVEMNADRTAITTDGQLNVRIEVEASGSGSPDVALPDFEGFAIVGRQVQRPMQFSFRFGSGATFKSSTNYVFRLQPQRVGTIQIPPVVVTVDGKRYQSQALSIQVTAGAGVVPSPGAPPNQTPPGAAQPAPVDPNAIDPVAFVRTVVDRPQPWVGEQVTVSVYLYMRTRVSASPTVTVEPSADGFWTYDLVPPDRRMTGEQEVIQGAVYQRFLMRQFAAFPLHEGELTIGSMAMRIDRNSLFDLFGGGAQPSLERQSAPVTVNARALPEAGKPPGEIAVGRFELTSALDRNETPTGSAVKLSVTVKGQGDVRSARVNLPSVDGLDVLQPEVRDIIEAPGGRVGGTRVFEWLLVPQRPGQIALPSPQLQTFDPVTSSYRTLQGEPLMLRAVGQAIAPPTPAPADTPATTASAEPTREWGPIRTHSALARRRARLATQPLYLIALALPPLAWLATLLMGGVRRRLARRADTPRGRALREARERMDQAQASAQRGDAAQFHAQAAAAVLGVLAARAGSEVHALTHPELKRHLAAAGADPKLAEDAVAFLERCDLARFGAGGGGALDANAAGLKALFERIEGASFVAQEGA